jgi:transaldolase
MSDPLAELSAAGVAVWLDDLSRERLRSGNLQKLIDEKHVVGVTTNPSIFQKALSEGDAYDDQTHDLALREVSVDEALRAITTYDVRWAADLLRPIYDRTDGVDGRVSLEVAPGLAHDDKATVAEAKALWWLVDRPNLFIKIPATREGVPAIAETLSEGVSVNVTLIFSLARYDEVMEAFLDGMERARANGHDLSTMASVASFFVSRNDTETDKRLDKIGNPEAQELRGTAAIANARLAYQHYEKVFSSDRWKALEAAGAKPQRPLWASTGVKDPAYEDTRYVVELIAPGVVNTMPEATLDAVADHGVIVKDSITPHYAEAEEIQRKLEEVGVSYDDVVQTLEDEGVQKFDDAWTALTDQVSASLRETK